MKKVWLIVAAVIASEAIIVGILVLQVFIWAPSSFWRPFMSPVEMQVLAISDARESPVFWEVVPKSPPAYMGTDESRKLSLQDSELWAYFAAERFTWILLDQELSARDKEWLRALREAAFAIAQKARERVERGSVTEAEFQQWGKLCAAYDAVLATRRFRGVQHLHLSLHPADIRDSQELKYRFPYPMDLFRPTSQPTDAASKPSDAGVR